MEVHYEPHLKSSHHKKHLKEYFKEFLMIFFAVFLGFLAENLREHIAEVGKEREYIKGFVQDLENDSVALNVQIKDLKPDIAGMDSIERLRRTDLNSVKNRKQLYNLTYNHLTYFPAFYVNNVTMQQIKYAGELHLFDKRNIADSLIHYYSYVEEDANTEGALVIETYKDIKSSKQKLFDYDILSAQDSLKQLTISIPKFDDRLELKIFFNKVVTFKRVSTYYGEFLENIKRRNTQLIAFLKSSYHLKDE